MIELLPFGDAALLIQFEQKIDPELNQQVRLLTSAIEEAQLRGLISCQAAYCSIILTYDYRLIRFETLKQLLLKVIHDLQGTATDPSKRVLHLPVCYEKEYAPDLDELSAALSLETAEIIALHTGTSYQVYMLGFLPGFPYMGVLPKSLYCHRKTTPRLRVPAGSIGLAGKQTGVYPLEVPGGWQLIGRTPIPVFDPQRTAQPFLFQQGDTVTFVPISTSRFQEIDRDINRQAFDLKTLYG